MADSTSSFDSRTMESIVVEDSSLNQSQEKECTSTGSRPAPTMVPVVFDKDNTSGKKEGRPIIYKKLNTTRDFKFKSRVVTTSLYFKLYSVSYRIIF